MCVCRVRGRRTCVGSEREEDVCVQGEREKRKGRGHGESQRAESV